MIRPDQSAATGGVNVAGGVGGSVVTGYTIEQHEAALNRQEARIRADLERAHAAERTLLQRELDEVRRQMADLDGSFETRRRELAEAEAALRDMADGLPHAKLDAALAALAEGDSGKAEALFAQVQAMEAAGIARAARAAHERGKLAAADIRWADAARHHAEAARLDPSFDHLFAARQLAWLSGDFPAALRFGEDLVKAAVAEHGDDAPEHATALNEHAVTLQATGRHAEAEPLYRQALAIRAKALGEAHPDYATDLNNLALLLQDTGRHAEAEPLHRQALAIRATALGAAHPDDASSLNNLASLPQDTGRHAEAEPLYQQALAIVADALGEAHPYYASGLNNLAALLQDTGRQAEAEPLYRQALAIRATALGAAHPDYASSLNNLAELLRATGRHAEAEPLYRQLLATDAKALGEAHPAYATCLNNLALLLWATGRHAEAEPLHRQALAILTAALGAEHPLTRTVAANLATLSPASDDGFRREAGEEAPQRQGKLWL